MSDDYHNLINLLLENNPNTRHRLYDSQVESTIGTENSQSVCSAGGGTYHILEVLNIFK